MNIAIIGAGAIGKKYIELIGDGLVNNMTLSAVRTSNPETAEWIASKYPLVDIEASTEEIYKKSVGIDSVLIASPHKTHLNLAREAMKNGKHILCEKPAGISAKEARAMAQEADDSGVSLGIIFQKRCLPAYIYIKKMIEAHELGDLKRIRLHSSANFRTRAYHKSSAWRSSWNGEGGGALINQGQHILDIWQWLFGMPLSLHGNVSFGKYNDFMVDDESEMLMKYPNQLNASLFFSTGELPKNEYLEIVGSKKKVIVSESYMKIWTFSQSADDYQKCAPCFSDEDMKIEFEELSFPTDKNLYLSVLENFERHVRLGEPLIAPGRDGENSLALCNAAYLSQWTNSEISFPLDSDAYERALEKKMSEEKARGADPI